MTSIQISSISTSKKLALLFKFPLFLPDTNLVAVQISSVPTRPKTKIAIQISTVSTWQK